MAIYLSNADGVLQHMRVGACTGLGVKSLARADASTVAMIRSGGMARTDLSPIYPMMSLPDRTWLSRSASKRRMPTSTKNEHRTGFTFQGTFSTAR